MDEAKTLVINVVAWNSKQYLPGLLRSLDDQDTRDFTLTIVDNASDDGTATWLQSERPDIAVLRNFRNQGFSRAHNQAIALALTRWSQADLAARYILIANPDLEFAPSAIRTMVEFMDAHPEVSSCCPKLLRAVLTKGAEDERPDVERTNVIDATGLLFRKSRRVVDRGAGEEDRGQYDALTDVVGCSGACVLLRASALEDARIAGEWFDEDMFAYQEDVDLAWRLRLLGHAARFVPGAVVWHHRHARSAPKAGWIGAWLVRRRKPPFVNFLSTRNHGWVLLKNDSAVNALAQAIWWVPYEIGKMIASLFSWNMIKAEAASLAGFPKMWKKRQEIRRRTKTTNAEIRKWFV